jgi:hypothetical protein
MNHLVGHDRGDFGIGVQTLEHSRGKKNETAREAKSIGGIRPKDTDFIGDWALHVGFQSIYDHRKVNETGRISDQFPTRFYLFDGLSAYFPLFSQLGVGDIFVLQRNVP